MKKRNQNSQKGFMLSMIRIILIIVLIIGTFHSCQMEDNMFATSVDTEISTDYLLQGNLDIYMQNEQVFRLKGKPGVETINLGNGNLSNFENCFVLNIASGAESVGTVSSAIITLEGIEILNTSDFKNNCVLYDFEVCNLSEQSTLDVEVRGDPGSYIDIWLEGKIKDPFAGDNGFFFDERDGQEYKWVRIGDKIWMGENLAYKTGTGSWAYNDDENNVAAYGRLYNWEAASSACPAGWHLPSQAEWTTLLNNLGGQSAAGGKLKEAGTSHWASPNTDATNETGFTALPGGDRGYDGTFVYLNIYGLWWTSTVFDPISSVYLNMHYGSSDIYIGVANNQVGMSVRCVKD